MDEITVERDGDNYLVRLSAQAFAAFAFWWLNQTRGEENGEAKKSKGGRPRKEPQPILPEVSA